MESNALIDNRIERTCHDVGLLLLRISVAGLMLFHGVAKLSGGIGGITGMLADAGLPTVFAYGVYVGELVAPILIIVGLFARLSAIVLAFNMVVAIALAHSGDFFTLNEFGGWKVELPMLYLLGSVCIALLGPGRYAVGKQTGFSSSSRDAGLAEKTKT